MSSAPLTRAVGRTQARQLLGVRSRRCQAQACIAATAFAGCRTCFGPGDPSGMRVGAFACLVTLACQQVVGARDLSRSTPMSPAAPNFLSVSHLQRSWHFLSMLVLAIKWEPWSWPEGVCHMLRDKSRAPRTVRAAFCSRSQSMAATAHASFQSTPQTRAAFQTSHSAIAATTSRRWASVSSP